MHDSGALRAAGCAGVLFEKLNWELRRVGKATFPP